MDELREAALSLGVVLMACDSGLRMAGMTGEALLTGAEVTGIPAFLSAVSGGAVVTL
jgi:predicted peroxiredoxin